MAIGHKWNEISKDPFWEKKCLYTRLDSVELNVGSRSIYDHIEIPPQPRDEGGGKRFDGGKGRPDLIPIEPLEKLSYLYESGSTKYGDRNWEKGMRWGRVFSSLLRHLWKFWRGERYDVDEVTGAKTHHMIAVIWNAMALYCYDEWKVGKDDRSIKTIEGPNLSEFVPEHYEQFERKDKK